MFVSPAPNWVGSEKRRLVICLWGFDDSRKGEILKNFMHLITAVHITISGRSWRNLQITSLFSIMHTWVIKCCTKNPHTTQVDRVTLSIMKDRVDVYYHRCNFMHQYTVRQLPEIMTLSKSSDSMSIPIFI